MQIATSQFSLPAHSDFQSSEDIKDDTMFIKDDTMYIESDKHLEPDGMALVPDDPVRSNLERLATQMITISGGAESNSRNLSM